MTKIDEARKTLGDAGYQVENLWMVEDVQSRYDCTEEEAMDVLIAALQNEATMERIWFAIEFHAEDLNLKLKE